MSTNASVDKVVQTLMQENIDNLKRCLIISKKNVSIRLDSSCTVVEAIAQAKLVLDDKRVRIKRSESRIEKFQYICAVGSCFEKPSLITIVEKSLSDETDYHSLKHNIQLRKKVLRSGNVKMINWMIDTSQPFSLNNCL